MESDQRDSIAGLVVGAFLLAGLFGLGAVLPRNIDFDAFFGVEAYRFAGVGVLLAAFGLLLALLLVPGLAGVVVRALSRAAGAVPGRIRLPLLLVASAAAFWLLPTYKLSGDAVPVVFRTSLGDIYASNPLTSFFAIAISRVLSWPAAPAIRLLSCAAGVVYVFAAVRIARECCSPGPARAAFAVVVLCSGSSALFFGSIEVYAPLVAAIGLYLFLGLRMLRREGSIVPPALALGVAFTLHGSAGLLLPSLAFLANGCRLRPIAFRRCTGAGLVFLAPVLLAFITLFFVHWGGHVPAATAERFGSFLGGNDQGPLLPLILTPTNVLHHYAILDAEHLVGVLNLVALAAPAGVLLLLLGRAPAADRPAFRFVAMAALFLLAFPVFWNVNYTLRQDWDLFSPMGVPLSVLGGLAFLSRGGGPRRALLAAALTLFAFLPLVLSNRGDHYDRRLCLMDLHTATRSLSSMLPAVAVERREINRRAGERYLREIHAHDPHGAEADTERAMTLAKSGHLTEAEAILSRVLALEPRNARAAEGLGSVQFAQNRMAEAREHLILALSEEPWRLPSRMNLARIALAAGDRDEAIRQLEAGLRRGGNHEFRGRALRELAELRSRRGDAQIAAALRDLAETR